ncbi:unnamed protein product [Gulo gulo]|uniref:Uncharacterized protein n=1 Tax=Gulo gulo TaxID=48420 RepID=A0A9X9Q4Z3_GULGU|nr:unnamed protein product [Gulo gulo]
MHKRLSGQPSLSLEDCTKPSRKGFQWESKVKDHFQNQAQERLGDFLGAKSWEER